MANDIAEEAASSSISDLNASNKDLSSRPATTASETKKLRVFNVNVGILGHVDSGKTSLAKALSSQASTAAFDKHPQSKQRGITLDLGFSTFSLQPPGTWKGLPYDIIQVTLVDCPGHASLVRTVIGGAQIIDYMILVVDAVRGFQTQTAECLVIGEITTQKMVVALNKIDLFPPEERDSRILKMTTRIKKTLLTTSFPDAQIIPVAASVNATDLHTPGKVAETIGLDTLVEALKSLMVDVPPREETGELVFSVDHCFLVKGQGTVVTGTVLQGTVKVGDTVEIPSLKISKKVKSMQMFRKPVTKAIQGDRVGICVAQMDADLMERGVLSTPGFVKTAVAALIYVERVRFFKGACQSKTLMHVTVGHETVMATAKFFSSESLDKPLSRSGRAHLPEFDFSREYLHEAELPDNPPQRQFWALLEFETPVTCPTKSLYIASRLDTDIHANTCRIAFHGHILQIITDVKYKETVLPGLKIYKMKERTGFIDRITDDKTLIAKGLFKKETSMEPFVNMAIHLIHPSKDGQPGMESAGRIESTFGQSGKVKCYFPSGIGDDVVKAFTSKKKVSTAASSGSSKSLDDVASGGSEGYKLVLRFKRYTYDAERRMIQ
ncbi:hypothetical protein SmJEL517_g05446 [Synchytrium microbalum]|uniref:Tr-type G domain-containing protein n=1 Tax=Synchytrium microbalum TaxID=1806994 RepID=A0A507BNZ0_9FUNG|nr:uncharacterized protein SmJEL517_g05446 [Synchytrium microbalum]TPX31137.1 hypothetical protein SmJEL517_g05446 [Synchytrium microbalum]